MKLIKPIALDDNNTTVSGANAEPAPAWEPIGRDYALDISSPLISVSGGYIYLLNRYTGELREHDIESGLTASKGMLSLLNDAAALAVSPNRQWVAVLTASSSGSTPRSDVTVYNMSGLTQSFAERIFAAFDYAPIQWAPDSSGLAYVASLDFSTDSRGVPRLGFVRTTDWSRSYSQTVASAVGDVSNSRDPVDRLTDLTFDASGRIFAVGAQKVTGYWQTDIVTYYKNVLLRLDPGTGAESAYVEVAKREAEEPDLLFVFIDYNPARDELIINGLSQAMDPHTLSLSDVQPSPVFLKQQYPAPAVSSDGTELVIIQSSVQPYIRRFSAATYASLQAVAAIDGRDVIEALYSSGFFVFSMSSGFRLIDRATLELDEQLYPTATAGDVYRFNDRRYEALLDNQERPDEGIATDPPSWLDLGVVNRLRAFDGKVTSQMVGGDVMSVTIAPSGLISGIGIFNVTARALRVEVLNATGGIAWDSGERSLIDPAFTGEDESDPIAQIPDYVITGFPFTSGQRLRVILSAEGFGVTRVGQIIAGTVREIGDSLFGARVGILDFSRKERDAFGNFDITERRFSNRAELPVSIRAANIAYVQRVLADVRATPVAYIGAESQRETIIYGFFRSFGIVLDGPVWSECVIEVEGL